MSQVGHLRICTATVKRETDTRVSLSVDAFEAFRKPLCAYNYALYGLNDMKTEANEGFRSLDNGGLTLRYISLLMKEIGKSSRIDDKVVQDQRQRDDYDLQDEGQDQPNEEEVEPRRSKRERTEKSFGPDLFLLW
ncbi:hypothetical protein Tco_1184002 [Tanacetum coccineum]